MRLISFLVPRGKPGPPRYRILGRVFAACMTIPHRKVEIRRVWGNSLRKLTFFREGYPQDLRTGYQLGIASRMVFRNCQMVDLANLFGC